ncbi:MAG TPA: ribosome biogenesis GTPase Der, partial [Acidobacteriota bacterium]|nr:ribosome biogenesis GTPase Der [Acidobacteriota bacterium]
MAEDRLPEVVIVGRPNVGKSTLFNRILGRRQAIVGAEVGLTRDRHCAPAEWGGRHFLLNDTGGVEWESADELLRKIQDHALYAVEDAELVLFVVDVREGMVPIEARIAMELRRRGIPMLLVVNKCDTDKIAEARAAEFHELGVQPVFAIAAEHGDGVADLLDAIIARLPGSAAEPEELPEGAVRVAVVGRPNVGKSSLVNAMLGQERVVVSEVSGTTRDAIDTLMFRDEQPYLLIDTAGIRRGGRREGFAEMVSVTIARRRMQRADVALLVVDATVGLTRQDVTIAAEAGESGCGVVVVVNKW